LKRARISRYAYDFGITPLFASSQSSFSLRIGMSAAFWVKAPLASRPTKSVASTSFPSAPHSRITMSSMGSMW